MGSKGPLMGNRFASVSRILPPRTLACTSGRAASDAAPLCRVLAVAAIVALTSPCVVLADAAQDFEKLSHRFEEQFAAEAYGEVDTGASHMRRLAAGPLRDDPESMAVAVNDHGLGLVRPGSIGRGAVFVSGTLELWKKAVGEDHVNVAIVRENLGHLCADRQATTRRRGMMRRLWPSARRAKAPRIWGSPKRRRIRGHLRRTALGRLGRTGIQAGSGDLPEGARRRAG